jgi:hypothetical protein
MHHACPAGRSYVWCKPVRFQETRSSRSRRAKFIRFGAGLYEEAPIKSRRKLGRIILPGLAVPFSAVLYRQVRLAFTAKRAYFGVRNMLVVS